MATKPRVAALDYSSQGTVTSTVRKDQLARFNVVIVGIAKSYGGSNHIAFCDYLRNINPAVKIFNYCNQSEVQDPPLSTDHTEAFNKVDAEDWWVRTSGGTRTRQFAQNNRYDVNFSMHCPVDGSGKRWNRWRAEWDGDKVATGAYDGAFLDNMIQRLRVDPSGNIGDWNLNGSNETYSTDPNHATNLMIRAGNQEYMDWHKTLRPTRLLMGNIDIGLAPVFGDTLEYAFMEGVMGASYSLETYSTWEAMMAIYEQVSAAHEWVVFNVHLSGDTDYAMMRYGLATCLLLDNGIFCARSGSSYENFSPWFDEYYAELGDPAASKELITGIWRRRYANGCVLVNPSKTSSATIDLTGQGYYRINGTQSTENDGSAVAEVSLLPRSGLVLVSGPSSLPIDSGAGSGTAATVVGPVEYPTFLPRPVALILEPSERRGLGKPGPLTARARQRDFLAQAEVDFPPMIPEHVQAWQNWWKDTLLSGGRWFLARDWPTMQGFVPGVYRILGVPKWTHIVKGVQSLKIRVQVRGRGEAPLIEGDPYWGNVVLLLKFEEENGSADTVDSKFGVTSSVYYWLRDELQTQVSTDKAKFGNSSWRERYQESGAFANRVPRFPSRSEYGLGTGDFTVEFWAWYAANAYSGSWPDLCCVADNAFDNNMNVAWALGTYGGGHLTGWVNGTRYEGSAIVPTGQWVHMAMTRKEGVLRLFLNGTIAGTTNNGIWANVTADLPPYQITVGGPVMTGSSNFNAYMGGGDPNYFDEMRVTRSVARYVENFEPPTVEFATK